MISGLELASFYSRPSMFGNFFGPCLEVVWRFEQKNTLYIGSLRAKLILACLG
jgi:hypothetical protein